MQEEPQTQPLPSRPLSKKQRIFVAEYVKNEHGTNAALKAYDTKDPRVANSIATENLSKPAITQAIEKKRKSLKQALIDKGIDEDYLAGKVEVLLTATDSEGNTDYTAVDKGLKHAASFHGVVSPDEGAKTQNIYNFVFSEAGRARISEVEDEIKAALTGKQQDAQEN